MLDMVAAGACMVAGLGLAAWGVIREHAALALPVTDAGKGYAMVRCLRTTIVGLALVAVGVGWLHDLPQLVVLACIIGGEELLETSVVVAATRHRAPNDRG